VMRFVPVVWIATEGPPPRRFCPAGDLLHPIISPAHPTASAERMNTLELIAITEMGIVRSSAHDGRPPQACRRKNVCVSFYEAGPPAVSHPWTNLGPNQRARRVKSIKNRGRLQNCHSRLRSCQRHSGSIEERWHLRPDGPILFASLRRERRHPIALDTCLENRRSGSSARGTPSRSRCTTRPREWASPLTRRGALESSRDEGLFS
jgi:hypothetical protein